MIPRIVPLPLALVWFVLAPLAGAALIEVKPVEGRPTIHEAIEKAAPGDEVRLAPGLYREHVRLKSGLALTAAGDATIDPSEPLLGEWRPAPEIGAGVWKIAVVRDVRGLLIDGRFLAGLDEKRTRVEGDWNANKLLASGPPRAGFRYVRGLFLWRKDEKTVYAALGGDDPRKHAWRLVSRTDPAVLFHQAKGARLEGVVLAGAYAAVRLSGGSEACVVRHCRIASFEKQGIQITEGATACVVEGNSITRGAWENWAVRERETTARREEYEVWQVHKLAGFYDRVGIEVFRAGARNRILDNHIRETFDGINVGDYAVESLTKPLDHPEHDQGTVISGNSIADTRDSGIEIGGGAMDVDVHHNHLLRTHGGLRFKVPRIGPVFIHHNWIEDDRGFNIWFSMDSSPAQGFIYHNTITGHSAALAYSSMEKGFAASATPRWLVANNLVVCAKGFFANLTRGALAPNFTASHNVVAGGGRPWPEAEGRETGSRYVEALPLAPDLALPPASPALGAATSLAEALGGRPLPGWTPGSEVGAGKRPASESAAENVTGLKRPSVDK